MVVVMIILVAVNGLLDGVTIQVYRQLLLLVHVDAAIAHRLNDLVESLLVHLLRMEVVSQLFRDSLQVGLTQVKLSSILVVVPAGLLLLLSHLRLLLLESDLGLANLLLERLLKVLQVLFALGD